MAWKAEWHQRSVLAWFFFLARFPTKFFVCEQNLPFLNWWDTSLTEKREFFILHFLKVSTRDAPTPPDSGINWGHGLHTIQPPLPLPLPLPPSAGSWPARWSDLRYLILNPCQNYCFFCTVHDVRSQIESIHKMCQSFLNNDCSGLTLYYGKKKLRVWIQHKIIGEVT